MSRLSFFFKRLVRMDWKAMWKTTKILKERSGKSRLWLLCDMLRCALKYNAGYVDYKIAEMYRLTDEQKKTQITRGLSNTIVRRMNDKAYWYLFDDKATFNRLFKDEVNRDWIELSDELSLEDWKAFLDRNDDLICKPLEGSSGVGIERHTKEEWRGREEAFLQELRDAPKADGQPRIYTHGEKEILAYEDRMKNGIDVNINTVAEMADMANYLGMDSESYLGKVDVSGHESSYK